MEHKIITLPASHFRRLARERLKGDWTKVIIACLIYTIIVGAMSIMSFFLYQDGHDNVKILSGIYYLLIFGAISLGLAGFMLQFYRREQAEAIDVFSGFERFFPAFILGVMIIGFIFLWTLLFIIPGIIAYYRYSMSFFIMHDHPEYTPRECFVESKRIMIGNKMSLFILHLTFLGWVILAALVAGIITALLTGFFEPSLFKEAISVIIASLASVIVTAYSQVATAAYYEELKSPFKAKYGIIYNQPQSEDIHIEPQKVDVNDSSSGNWPKQEQ